LGGCDVASGRKERWNASQDTQDAGDAENTSLASGRNADGSDAGSIFADVGELRVVFIGNYVHNRGFKYTEKVQY